MSYHSVDEGLDHFSKDLLVTILQTFLICGEKKNLSTQKQIVKVKSLLKEYGEDIQGDEL